MPIVGSFAGASSRAYGLQAGVLIGDFENIETVTVGSGGATTISFSSIPQTYTHIQLRCLNKGTDSGTVTNGNLLVTFNSDTGANYASHYLIGNGSSASSGATTSGTFIYAGKRGNAATANIFGVSIIDVLDYANTNKFKTVRYISGVDANGSGEVILGSGHWRNTNAISSLSIASDTAGGFGQYMSVALYGIKG